jgi:hypothetical protein
MVVVVVVCCVFDVVGADAEAAVPYLFLFFCWGCGGFEAEDDD